MQIVIDIPEKAFEVLTTRGVDWLGAEHILSAVANGTPLPKGHGRLIDADELDKCTLYHTDYDGSWCVKYTDIYSAPTIIEADKEADK